MFLLITLCIIMWYVMHRHKKRKSLYSARNMHFMSPISFYNQNSLTTHAFELTNMKINVAGTGLGMDASTCK